MNPKLCKRLPMDAGVKGPRRISFGSQSEVDPRFSKTSVRDQAALLLSISDIVKSEIGSGEVSFSDLWADREPLPKFPILSKDADVDTSITPRTSTLTDMLTCSLDTISEAYPANRIRSVSMDSPTEKAFHSDITSTRRTSSPLCREPISTVTPINSPRSPCCGSNRRVRLPLRRKTSLRLSHKAKKEKRLELLESPTNATPAISLVAEAKTGPLQGECPKGLTIKKIMRRKFSWKNYPELEQFLIANREEYLRHSALNYTVQQKQYNNRLTDRLLELATEHGYVFEEKEFSFVTVRDRIRCYYKSYVQSAKKRGILMGYAARKAGLLTEDDLEKSAGTMGQIINPN